MSDNPRPSFGKKQTLALGAIILLMVAGFLGVLIKVFSDRPAIFGGGGTSVPIPINVDSSGQSGAATPTPGGDGQMTIHLSEGQQPVETLVPLPLASGDALSAEQVAAILNRLPALPVDPNQQTDFKLPPDVLPPPRPGNTIPDVFPPVETAGSAGTVDMGPLQVLRYAPEGEIPIAPFVSVTFNQPMVPLGTLQDLAKLDVPVTIEPPLAGTWRWLGTKTLTFEYDSELIDRLPKATEYRVTVPAGVKSASGAVLAEAVSWTFRTPPPKVITTYPYGDFVKLEPIFFVAFDQRIDPAAVLATVHLDAGGRSIGVAQVTETELEKDEAVAQMAKNAQEGRWLAFRALESLPADTAINLTIGPGTPSAEGPLSTTEPQSYGFRTYAPLRIEDHGCYWYDSQCRPLTPFTIRFNNPLNMDAFSEGLLSVTPEIPGVSVNIYGTTIEIRGQTKGQTTYTVTVSGEIQDIFGQKLGKDAHLDFKVGKAEPFLSGPGQNFVTLDPVAAKPVFSVYAINYSQVLVKIYKVEPANWPAFKQYLRDWQQTDRPTQMPGKLVYDKSLNLDIPADTLTQVDIPLGDYLNDGYGQFVVIIEPPKPLLFETDEQKWRRFSQTVISWAQVTQIGLDAFSDYEQMTAFVTSLKDGSPLQGVSIAPQSGGEYVTTADGTARFDLPGGSNYLVASLGKDSALLPRSTYYWGDDPWQSYPPNDTLSWYVFDDRKMYRPGEEVHIKGWIRLIGGRQNGDVGPLRGTNQVSYQISDATGNPIASGSSSITTLGGFDFTFTIPERINLGSAYINLSISGDSSGIDGWQSGHQFQIQEFRRPEFEVIAQNETSGPYFAGTHAIVSVEAKYYAGGPLPNADVTWNVTTAPGSYSPPNWPEFSFGEWIPWWWFYDFGGPNPGTETRVETYTGKTDAAGFHYLRLDFEQQGQAEKPRPLSVTAQATVMDVNRQAWASSTALLVHPAELYIGLRSDRYFVERGAPLKIDFIVTDLDGKPITEIPAEIRAARLEWKYKNGQWAEEEVSPQVCQEKSKSEPVTCTFTTEIGGSYKITATVTDSQGRKNQSSFTRWVSGGQLVPSRKVEQEKVTLIPDKQTYQPGDTAQILVQSPFSPAEGLLTVSRSGTLYTERFRIENGTSTLNIPIEDKHIPNLVIQVDLTGSAQRLDDNGDPLAGVPPRPAYATGTLNLSIPPLSRTLKVEVTPAESKLEPGAQTKVDVTVRDASGQPVQGAELAVVVVDEAILALTNYQMADPLGIFYSARPSYWSGVYARSSIVLLDPLALSQQVNEASAQRDSLAFGAAGAPMATMAPAAMEAPAMDGMKSEESAPGAPIRIRADFNPLATFAPAVSTDMNGVARVPVTLPDNLTRYRIMVVVVDESGKKFGAGESNLTARLPLMVRPSAPRFLNFGDKFELPVVLQNQTDFDMTVEVVARATNLEFNPPLSPHFEVQKWGDERGVGLRVTVPANDRIEVRFPASTVKAGTATIQIAAISGDYADAATVSLPVYTPATTEAFATYGVIDEGATSQPVLEPTGVFPQYGGMEITTSSTALQALTDAVLYLVKYPFECSEQLASRILAVSALRDVLTAFKADGLPTPAEMESSVGADIAKLQSMQNWDGGYPYWRRGFDSVPFNSIHVTHALILAQQKGFSVPDEIQQSSLNYIRQIENYYPNWYDKNTRWTLSAYALYVRNLAGERDAARAEALFNEAGLENLSMEAIGWLWSVIDDQTQLDAIRRYIGNRVVETPGAANFTTYYSDQTYLLLSSDRRTDAILLDALMEDNPQSDLIVKVVNGLLAHRTKGRWYNTQENVFALIALDRYFNTYETQTPDFVARIWLGNTYVGSSEFRGRTTDLHETLIPMQNLLDETIAGGGQQDLILSKEGPGRLYYRLGLRYAPTDLSLPPLEMGFVVQRSYEGVDDPKDVWRDADGTWHIKAGARVRVKIKMVADNRRYHVALVDPLPAGLEIVNPALAVSGSVPQDPSQNTFRYGWWWWGTWYEHQNMRDERAEAFTSLLWDGVYDYTYIARATTPGKFVVPPAKAEEMYSPEVFGRSASDWVIVE